MNLPSSTSEAADSAATPAETCEQCGSQDSWVIHSARHRGVLRFFCTHCLLRNHPTSFCPTCFAFYDSSPPHHSCRVSCSKCGSHTHLHCAGGDEESSSPPCLCPYLCPPCLNPSSFSFFRPIINADGVRCMDKPLSEAFLCAAKISAFSMSRAVSVANMEVEWKGRECAVSKKRLREAVEDVVKLNEKVRLAIAQVEEESGDQDQKPKQSVASKVIESSGQVIQEK
ncbi:hypothetical protein BRARA_H02816 [Brassica rapa]|uniref:Uncharacterized protein n=1 Tax=Brassica campestris TaxID=3711 RepID=A0A397YFE8_BRACM|nr:hypothetical protein BRARA_H02816 [Brassica rapa]